MESQSLSGWDGVFHERSPLRARGGWRSVAIPFRVGWGFSPLKKVVQAMEAVMSQSLSGWDGVFHGMLDEVVQGQAEESQSLSGWDGVFHDALSAHGENVTYWSQSLSGWDGVFHNDGGKEGAVDYVRVAIPFRVGWGFSPGAWRVPIQ